MQITINIEETRELTIEPLETYLIRTDWEHQGGHVWYKPHYHVIFAENLQHAINTLATDEKRSSGAIYEDIIEMPVKPHLFRQEMDVKNSGRIEKNGKRTNYTSR